jgi:hypothetical protein
MHGRFGPADAHAGADLQVNYIYLLSPSCSQPTFWSNQIMMITSLSTREHKNHLNQSYGLDVMKVLN